MFSNSWGHWFRPQTHTLQLSYQQLSTSKAEQFIFIILVAQSILQPFPTGRDAFNINYQSPEATLK